MNPVNLASDDEHRARLNFCALRVLRDSDNEDDLFLLVDETDLIAGWKALVVAIPFRHRVIPVFWFIYNNQQIRDGIYKSHNEIIQYFCGFVYQEALGVMSRESQRPHRYLEHALSHLVFRGETTQKRPTLRVQSLTDFLIHKPNNINHIYTPKKMGVSDFMREVVFSTDCEAITTVPGTYGYMFPIVPTSVLCKFQHPVQDYRKVGRESGMKYRPCADHPVDGH